MDHSQGGRESNSPRRRLGRAAEALEELAILEEKHLEVRASSAAALGPDRFAKSDAPRAVRAAAAQTLARRNPAAEFK